MIETTQAESQVAACRGDATMRSAIVAAAIQQGFDLAGIALAPVAENGDAANLRERFTQWVDHDRAGEMDYLKRVNEDGEFVRASLHAAFPWARSVLVCAMNYNADAPRSIDDPPKGAGWVARYAWSGHEQEDGSFRATDYHDVLLGRLRRVEDEVRKLAGSDVAIKAYVDTGPLVERHFAQAAGIGWTGKNACILNQQTGSWLLLAVLVMGIEFQPDVTVLPAADRCGSCTRCIEACPTDALIAPRQMDASRCISYLTIEKKREIPEDLRALMGRQVFGCDICQDVCPWNRRAPIAASGAMAPRRELINPSLDWLASMRNRDFRDAFNGSPLERTGRKRLQRNVAIAMGNSGEARYLRQLKEWSMGEDRVLADASLWAMSRIAQLGGAEAPVSSASIDE